MKRFSAILLVFILLTATACSAQNSDTAQDNAEWRTKQRTGCGR